jgi:hypothetical protein
MELCGQDNEVVQLAYFLHTIRQTGQECNPTGVNTQT